MPSTRAHSPSPMSDAEDEQVSDMTEIEESVTAEAGPSSEPEVKAGSSGKGKGKGGGQQNRARVTVVCAECKRLKLKCDRQQPCGNCKAKEKTDKCLYSQEAASKVDVQSLHNRVMAVEIVLSLVAAGVPVIEYESSHPAVAAEVKKRLDDFLARGGKLIPGPNALKYLNQAQNSSDVQDGDDGPAKGSLLSDLHDIPHPYTHIILESEGESFDGFCTCDHDQHDLPTSTIEDSGKVKEEDVRANVDVNMIPETVSQSQPRSPTKAGPTSSSVSLLPDALSDLPPLKVYYPNPQVTEEATPSFYPAVSDSKKAYTGSSPPVTPSTTERSLPLGKSSGAPRSGPTSKPSVTPALIQCLPASTRCNEMLGTAQAILEDIPIELGLRSRTAALPQELIDKFPGEMAKATGWVALSKRVKRCLNRRKDQALRPPPRHKVTPAASSPIAIPANPQGPKDRKRAQAAAAVYGRAGDVNFKDKDNAPPPPPIKLDPRIISHQEKERSKPKPPGSTTQSHSGPPLIIDESLPFFAVVCSLLAFGADPAKDRDTSCKESAPYLLALAQQALGLWVDGGEHLATDRTDEAVKEARADYFRACSLAIQFYLMRTSPSVSRSRRDKNSLGPYRHPNERQLVNLMSKMAAQLAAWDYEEGLVPVRDAEEGPSSPGGPAELKLIPKIAVAEGQEARIRLLWQIMFHDACIAGMFQREPFIPRSRYTTTVLPTLVPDYCEMVADVLKSCDDQDENRSAAGGGSPQPASVDKPALKERREVEEERLRTERFYLGLRARITQLSNVVDRRLAKGYSLEQAAVLAGDVQALFEGLPDELRWGIQKAVEGTSSELLANGESLDSIIVSQTPPTSSNVAKGKGKGRAVDGSPKPKSARVSLDLDEGEVQSTQSSQEAAASKLRTRTLSCELALMARLLVVRIYSPFAPKLASAPLDSTSSLTIPDGLLDASKAVIRLAKLIHRPGQAHAAPSTILAIYPFDRLVLDATLMCAQHCFGGTVIKKKKDDKVGVQKKDAGSAELMQTIGIGLDLLDAVYSASQQAPSSSSSTHNLDVSNTLEAKIVASLRKQWLLKNSSFTPAQSRKRTRSTMEGKSAGASVEPAKKTSSPPQAEPEPGSAMDEPRSVPSAAPDDSPSKDSTPSPPNQPSNSTQPSAPSRKTPAVPLNPETRVLGREVVERKRGKAAHASSASQVGVRLRGPGATNATKRKQDTKAQALSQQPLMTTAARTVKEDGKLGYVDEDQAPNAPGPQRPPTAPPPPLVHQITPPQPPAQLSPPSHPYNGYDSPPAVQAPYSTHPSNPSPASQYQPTFEGGMVADTSVPPTPYQEYGYSGYPPQPIQHPPYHQQHQPTYTSHPNAPMPSSVPTGMAPDGYFNHQHGGNSGYANHSGYAPPAGPDVYMKQPVAPSYSTLAYPGEMPNAPGSSMSAWQDQQNTPVQMQQPLPQHDFSWQPPIADGWQ